MAEASICIVSKDRKEELFKTLCILKKYLNTVCEIHVFLDNCTDNSASLKQDFPEVIWYESSKQIGPSRARHRLFNEAKGDYIFGFDDDAHPLNADFIKKAIHIFQHEPDLAVLSFEELKGIFNNDAEALKFHVPEQQFYCNAFTGCGFAVRKSAYQQIKGFPEWMDIYGEEACVSIQFIEKGFKICYTSAISVNHRVNREHRRTGGSNAFRFEKQLCHAGMYFLIYYPIFLIPKKLFKLFWHNLVKYAFTDWRFFKGYCMGKLCLWINLPKALKNRHAVSLKTVKSINTLPPPKYG
ncbi:glycosyltransferase family 2 protein [Leeuwenhoekiella sp. A2]|uniref:glycosyltransferase family 2 protein n=1 Tax=Leeuwenhoekiella sp. A2 TaxID=3141460 RepID=UPI003A800E68